MAVSIVSWVTLYSGNLVAVLCLGRNTGGNPLAKNISPRDASMYSKPTTYAHLTCAHSGLCVWLKIKVELKGGKVLWKMTLAVPSTVKPNVFWL